MQSYWRRHARRNGILLSIALLIGWANTLWTTPGTPHPNSSGASFADPNSSAEPGTPPDHTACLSCHKQIVESHLHTTHWLSSTPATAATIKGSFKQGHNHFVYNDHMEVVMEKKNGVFLQTAYFNNNLFESEAFDIVIGWRKGQTYLYWDNNRLLQLPISYYAPANAWCNSPGYPTNLVYYDKQVPGQCMECHATSASLVTDDNGSVTYDKSSILLGIDCQRCHGDATRHIAWHQAHPADTLAGRYILNAKNLSRRQRLDACALCHSGFRKQLTPSFSFKVGDTLDKFSTAVYDSTTAAEGNLDVHGNQYGLLTSSKCFRMSSLDCSSCHNVHTDEAGKLAVFSQRCISCHNPIPPHPGKDPAALAANCIDCHMPALPSNKIKLQLTGLTSSPLPDLVRTHHIAIYPVKK